MRLFILVVALWLAAPSSPSANVFLDNLFSRCVPSCIQTDNGVGRDWCTRYCGCVVDRTKRAKFAQTPLRKLNNDDPVDDLEAMSALEAGITRNMQRLSRVCAASTPRR